MNRSEYKLKQKEFDDTIGQEPLAQIQSVNLDDDAIGQEPPAQIQDITETLVIINRQDAAQIENDFIRSPISKINWASHMVLMNRKLPHGIRYWYMKQSVEFGWSSNILDMQIDSNLFQRQVEKQKVNNFAATLPKPHSDLANYLLKDPYILTLQEPKNAPTNGTLKNNL